MRIPIKKLTPTLRLTPGKERLIFCTMEIKVKIFKMCNLHETTLDFNNSNISHLYIENFCQSLSTSIS